MSLYTTELFDLIQKEKNEFTSTSFCIYGASLEQKQVEQAYKKMFPDKDLDVEDYCIAELLEEMHVPYWYPHDYIYVGRSWSQIGDDETGREFKIRAENEIHKIFGNNITCNISSSSFCIYGASMDPEETFEKLLEIFPQETQHLKEAIEIDEDEYDIQNDAFEFMIKKLKEIDSRFEYVFCQESNFMLVGISPMEIRDDETGAQFKSVVALGLEQILDYTDKCGMDLGEYTIEN